MKFNATLFRRTAHAMKLNGLLDAGYSLLSVGGSTYKHQGLAPLWNHTDPKQYTAVIVRNSSGHYQIDPNDHSEPPARAVPAVGHLAEVKAMV